MSDIGIVVLANNRPNYLHIALQSLFNVTNIEDYYVTISIDPRNSKLSDILAVCSEFQIDTINIQHKHQGILNNHLYGAKDVFDKGYKFCFYLEDDFIIRKDTMTYLESVKNENAFFININCGWFHYHNYTPPQRFVVGYNCHGVMLKKSNFDILYNLVVNKNYLELRRPDYDYVLGDVPNIEMHTHDGIYSALSQQNNWISFLPDKSYLFHFGICNSIYGVDGSGRDIESAIFNGDKKTWLDNLLKLQSENKIDNPRFEPKFFVYD